jgi:hypothetical protein
MTDKLNDLNSPLGEHQSQIEAFAASMTTLGRVSVPEDVANAVSFLSGPDSDWVTGQVCYVWILGSIILHSSVSQRRCLADEIIFFYSDRACLWMEGLLLIEDVVGLGICSSREDVACEFQVCVQLDS